ncbi:MAG: glycosyltransferase family 4 protein [Acidimicrobiia bacterium]
MDICMFVKNSFEYDARVTKEAKTLIQAGHDVTVVALYAPNVTPMEETTIDGIHVVRVPRSSFGIPALNRIAKRYAGSIEARHVRLTGETYNEDLAQELGRLSAPSTVAPNDPLDIPIEIPEPSDSPPSSTTRLWGSISTPVLRSIARLARWGFRLVKGAMGQQSQWLKHRAIDRRMIDVGVGTGADVFHSHDLNTLRVGVHCKSKTGALLVYDSHELQTERNRMTDKGRKNAIKQEGGLLRSVDAMIVASPSWIPWNRRLYGTLPDPTVALLNVPEPTVVDGAADLRRELDIAPGQSVVIYQGSIQENRGIEPAIDAVAELNDVTLVVIGYGYHRPALETLVRDRGLDDKVLFFGPVPNDQLISYSASADVGLANIVNSSVSYHTSLPNKLFEYVMAGIPVVGSDSPEIGRVIKEQNIGEVCDADDPTALAQAIGIVLEDPARYDAALSTTSRRYNWNVEQNVLVRLYDTLDNTV